MHVTVKLLPLCPAEFADDSTKTRLRIYLSLYIVLILVSVS
jgi:hypothetical protein